MSQSLDVAENALSESRGVGVKGTEYGITVVINTLNEESNLGECINSVRGLTDQIVVCDMHSEDKTQEIARHSGARVVLHPRTGFVEPARRFAISHVRTEWVLVLDADERMTDVLSNKLKEVVAEDTCDAVSFWSLYWYFGGWVRHGGFFSGQWRRFFRRNIYFETYDEGEELVHHNFVSLTKAKRVCQLPKDYYMLHYAYPTVEKYLSKTLGMYARIEGEQYVKLGRRFSLLRMIGEPVKEFSARFILRRGYLDGMRGFVLACLYAGYRFSVWANVWFLQNGTESQR
ncbi:MAG: glycosyltransferase family 2 protein [Nitrospira sp.]|nr:glycosyltransferase family 2 protein [Nitrospira sp.]